MATDVEGLALNVAARGIRRDLREGNNMNWNFRVIRSQDALGVCYAMHECPHEGDALPTSWAPEQSPVRAGSRDDLFWTLAAMTKAISEPVLEVRDGAPVEVEPALELTEELKAAIKKPGRQL